MNSIQIDKPQLHMTTDKWKGLDTGRMPVFLGYDQTERMIAALLDRAARGNPRPWSASRAAGWCRRRWPPASWHCRWR